MPRSRPAGKRLGSLSPFKCPKAFHTVTALAIAADMTGAGRENGRPDCFQVIDRDKNVLATVMPSFDGAGKETFEIVGTPATA